MLGRGQADSKEIAKVPFHSFFDVQEGTVARHVSFEEMAELIVGLGRQAISTSPVHRFESDGRALWAVYSATVSAGANQFEFSIVFFTSECTIDAISAAGRYVTSSRGIVWNWIYANQLEQSPIVLEKLRNQHEIASREAPRQHGQRIMSIRDYIVNEFKAKLDRYREFLSGLEARHFVHPSIQTTIHSTNIRPIEYLTDGLSAKGGSLGVLIGEAGQGKTYYVWKAIESLNRDTAARLPIFVSSGQWKQMTPAILEDLSAVIAYSFSSAGVGLDIPSEKADRYVDVFLRSGIFSVIFDSFDEYVLGNLSNVSTFSAFHAVRRLCASTEAPIFITTRASFWSDLDEALNQAKVGPDIRIVRWSLKPFTEDHAKAYFRERFDTNPDQANRAISLFRSASKAVGESGKDLVGRGYFLLLIYELVLRDSTNFAAHLSFGGVNPAQWIIDRLCDREVERQGVVSTALQRKLLRIIATRRSGERLISDSELINELRASGVPDRIAVNTVAGGEKGSRARLRDHPLMRFQDSSATWDIRYQVVSDLIIAEYLVESINAGSPFDIDNFIRECGLKQERLSNSNLFGFAVDILALDPEKGSRLIRSAIGNVLKSDMGNGFREAPAMQLLTSLAVAWISHVGSDMPRTKKCNSLMSMFPSNDFRGAIFTGQLASFDFSSCTFEGVTFHNVGFINCRFSNETRFSNCQFYGGSAAATINLGLADFAASTKMDEAAEIFIAKHMIRSKTRSYKRDEFEKDFKLILKKLAPSDMHFPNITEGELFSGTMGLKHCRQIVVHTLLGSLIVKTTLESGNARYQLAPDYRHVVVVHNSNGNFHGKLNEIYQKLLRIVVPDDSHRSS